MRAGRVNRPSRGQGPNQVDAIEDLVATALLGAFGVFAAISLIALAGAELAATLFGGGPFRGGFKESLEALIALPGAV